MSELTNYIKERIEELENFVKNIKDRESKVVVRVQINELQAVLDKIKGINK